PTCGFIVIDHSETFCMSLFVDARFVDVNHTYYLSIISISTSNSNLIGITELFQLVARPVEVTNIALEPPKHFANASLQNYQPEKSYPSQRPALARIQEFIETLERERSNNWYRRIIQS